VKLEYDGEEVKPETIAEGLNISVLELISKIRKNVPINYLGLPVTVCDEIKPKRKSGYNYAGRIPFDIEILEMFPEGQNDCNTYRVKYFLEGKSKTLEEIIKVVGGTRNTLQHKFKDVKSCNFEGYRIDIKRVPKNSNLYEIVFENGRKYSNIKVREAIKLTGATGGNITSVKLENDWIYRTGYKIRRVFSSDKMVDIFLKRIVAFWGKDKVMEYLKGLKC